MLRLTVGEAAGMAYMGCSVGHSAEGGGTHINDFRFGARTRPPQRASTKQHEHEPRRVHRRGSCYCRRMHETHVRVLRVSDDHAESL